MAEAAISARVRGTRWNVPTAAQVRPLAQTVVPPPRGDAVLGCRCESPRPFSLRSARRRRCADRDQPAPGGGRDRTGAQPHPVRHRPVLGLGGSADDAAGALLWPARAAGPAARPASRGADGAGGRDVRPARRHAAPAAPGRRPAVPRDGAGRRRDRHRQRAAAGARAPRLLASHGNGDGAVHGVADRLRRRCRPASPCRWPMRSAAAGDRAWPCGRSRRRSRRSLWLPALVRRDAPASTPPGAADVNAIRRARCCAGPWRGR